MAIDVYLDWDCVAHQWLCVCIAQSNPNVSLLAMNGLCAFLVDRVLWHPLSSPAVLRLRSPCRLPFLNVQLDGNQQSPPKLQGVRLAVLLPHQGVVVSGCIGPLTPPG